jgi:hypothetical protein
VKHSKLMEIFNMPIFTFNGGPNNNGGASLGFGNAVSTNISMADPSVSPNGTKAVHSPSTSLVFVGGTANYFDNPVVYGRVTSLNGTAKDLAHTSARSSWPQYHTSIYGYKTGITAFDIVSGQVTKVAGYGTRYPLTATGDTEDNVIDSIASPYDVPANLTYLGGTGPVTTTYTIEK